jgi:peptide/nickel transport system permease protein
MFKRSKQTKRSSRFWTVGSALAVFWLVGLTLLAFLAPYLSFIRLVDQRVPGASRYAYGPGWDFWFGSDRLGRDVFARCIYGAQISLRVATFSIAAGLIIGGALGLVAGYFRGKADGVINIVLDALLAFPALIISILIVGRLDVLSTQPGWTWITRTWSVTIVLSLLAIAPIARIVRAQTMSLAQREFVLAARSVGAKGSRIVTREILPNLVPAMTSVAFTGVAVLLVAEGGLAFLGYSVESPFASWGKLIAENRERIAEAWWATVFPAVMLFLTVLAFNVIGDRFARRFDIREAAL